MSPKKLEWTEVVQTSTNTTRVTSINGQRVPDGAIQLVTVNPSTGRMLDEQAVRTVEAIFRFAESSRSTAKDL